MVDLPLYRIVSKLTPTKFGSRKVFLVKSHVPSPTTIVSEEYELDPGGDKVSAGAMMGDSGAAHAEWPPAWRRWLEWNAGVVC